MSTNPEDSLSRAEELLARLEKTRAELEHLSQANDAEKALDVLTELSELSKAIEDELQKVKRNAETDAEP
jgi:phosphoribosyl 1,2-cyclic phosphodiesterase